MTRWIKEMRAAGEPGVDASGMVWVRAKDSGKAGVGCSPAKPLPDTPREGARTPLQIVHEAPTGGYFVIESRGTDTEPDTEPLAEPGTFVLTRRGLTVCRVAGRAGISPETVVTALFGAASAHADYVRLRDAEYELVAMGDEKSLSRAREMMRRKRRAEQSYDWYFREAGGISPADLIRAAIRKNRMAPGLTEVVG